MYKFIKDYITTAISSVGLKEYDLSLDLDLLPINQMDSYYHVKFESIEEEEAENYGIDTINVNLELWFLLANKKDNYELAIDKVNAIKRLIKLSVPTEETSISIVGIHNVKADNLNNIIKGNWLKCNLNFEVKVID